jgi:hypothetical protein
MSSHQKTTTHPKEQELALLASGDCGGVSRFFLERHVRRCSDCADKIKQFEGLRAELADLALPDVDWNSLAAEMRANIRLGLEAGECVRVREPRHQWNPRLVVAFASLSFLVCAGLVMRSPATLPRHESSAARTAVPVLESTGSGTELSDGASSITLMNHEGSLSDQTVSAEGEIRARSVEGGAVTITSVSLD